MAHWTAEVATELADSLGEFGVEVANRPSAKPERFESVALAGIVRLCLEEGFVPVSDRLDLSHTNHLPYRRVTQGSGTNQRPELSELVEWTTPIFEVERGERTLSFFREGSPLLRSRKRPDVLVYDGSFDVTERSDVFVGDHVEVTWDGRRSGQRRYKRETDANGPIVAERSGEPLSPVLGVEVSLDKSGERLKEQFGLLRDLGSDRVVGVLEHENPCSPGAFPPMASVFTARNQRAFHRTMDQIGDRMLRETSDE